MSTSVFVCVCCCHVQLISLYSGNRLPRDLIVQLCDEADNPTPEENIRIQLSRDAAAVKVNHYQTYCIIRDHITAS